MIEDGLSEINGLPDWIEQLVAESTGKSGKGILPVVGADPGDADDELLVGIDTDGVVTVAGPLGAQFLVWEYATAVAGRVLGIDPFNQPNVAESKENTAKLLDRSELPVGTPILVDGPVEVYGELPPGAEAPKDLSDVLTGLLEAVPSDGYLAVMAYLDREAAFDAPYPEGASFEEMTDVWSEADPATLRGRLAVRTERPVTFGWPPVSCTPPASTTRRPAERGVPADHRGRRERPGGSRQALHPGPPPARPGAGRPGRPDQPGAPRRAAAPDRPRRRCRSPARRLTGGLMCRRRFE